jgi:two-component system, cell cycle sensor histidine kinase and response regulator CckA
LRSRIGLHHTQIPSLPEVQLHPEIETCIRQFESDDRAVIATEVDGRVLYWNADAEQLYGWSSDEAVGRNVVDLTPSELSKDEAHEIMQALNLGQPWSGEFVVRGKDGSRFTVHVVDVPVTDDAGRIVGIVGFSRRVSYMR